MIHFAQIKLPQGKAIGSFIVFNPKCLIQHLQEGLEIGGHTKYLMATKKLIFVRHDDPYFFTEKRIYFILHFHVISQSFRKSKARGGQEQNLEMGTEAKTLEEHNLLACSLGFAQPVFFYNSRPPVHCGLCHLTSTINEENAPKTFQKANLMRIFFHLTSFSPDDYTLFQVDKN